MLMKPLRHMGIKDENQPQQEDRYEVVTLHVTKDMMHEIVTLQKHVMGMARERKDYSGTNAEETEERVTNRLVEISWDPLCQE